MKKSLIVVAALLLTCIASEARVVKGKVMSGSKDLSGVVVTDVRSLSIS